MPFRKKLDGVLDVARYGNFHKNLDKNGILEILDFWKGSSTVTLLKLSEILTLIEHLSQLLIKILLFVIII